MLYYLLTYNMNTLKKSYIENFDLRQLFFRINSFMIAVFVIILY